MRGFDNKVNEYAVYQGESLVMVGTAKEIAQKLDVPIQTVYYWASKKGYHEANKEKINFVAKDKRARYAIKMEDDWDARQKNIIWIFW